MPQRPHLNKSILAAAVAVLLMLSILLFFFFESKSGAENEPIVLPDPPAEAAVPEKNEEAPADDFVQVSAENVLSVLQKINKPSSYHQIYTVTVGSDATQALHTVELWVNGSLLHAEVSDGILTKTIITDGSVAYLWYDGSGQVVSVDLSETAAAGDLLGLISYDYLLSLAPEQITDADFLVLEDPQIQCLYVCSQDAVYVTTRLWIDLETGLLYTADVLEQSRQVYTLRQDAFELLAEEDEAFYDRFCLPDGSAPFSTKTETPLP